MNIYFREKLSNRNIAKNLDIRIFFEKYFQRFEVIMICVFVGKENGVNILKL
jgi:hypothetical protein